MATFGDGNGKIATGHLLGGGPPETGRVGDAAHGSVVTPAAGQRQESLRAGLPQLTRREAYSAVSQTAFLPESRYVVVTYKLAALGLFQAFQHALAMLLGNEKL